MTDYKNDIINTLRDVEVEILDKLHEVCVKNNLHYSLAYGTLIGAVRHQGFIPWDDDIDVMMPREDYEKLIKIWPEEVKDGYIMQDYRNEPDLPDNFAKIRKDNTAFISFETEKKVSYHKGVFIDVFPFDRVAPSPVTRKLQKLACMIVLLYSRGYDSGKKGIIGVVEKILLRIIPHRDYKRICALVEPIISRWNNLARTPYFGPCTLKACTIYFPKNMFDEYCLLPFEGKEYYAVSQYKRILSISYGDYMQLPPEEERVLTHHPLYISFSKNYEDVQ